VARAEKVPRLNKQAAFDLHRHRFWSFLFSCFPGFLIGFFRFRIFLVSVVRYPD